MRSETFRDEVLMMRSRRVWRAVLSPWMILLFLAVGWGPVFIADFVRTSRADLSAHYVPQAFAMGWLPVTLHCSIWAGVYIVGHAIRLIVMLGRLLLADLRSVRRSGARN